MEWLENYKKSDEEVLEKEVGIKPAPTTAESSIQLNYIIKYLKSIIEERKYNIIYDGTGAQIWNYKRLMEYFKKLGYKVILLYIKTDVENVKESIKKKKKSEAKLLKLFNKLNQTVNTKTKSTGQNTLSNIKVVFSLFTNN